MKNKLVLPLTVLFFLLGSFGFSQESQKLKKQLTDYSIEDKQSWAVWRTDYYICTGIAFAKSLGMTANDFTAFVGSKHNITSPNDTSINAVVRTLHLLITNYPKGQFEIITESNSSVSMKWNRPYKSYFGEEPILGVTIEEFEAFLYGHAAIMTKRIGINFKYDIKVDTVFGTLTRYR
jgi:hypothetical protein